LAAAYQVALQVPRQIVDRQVWAWEGVGQWSDRPSFAARRIRCIASRTIGRESCGEYEPPENWAELRMSMAAPH